MSGATGPELRLPNGRLLTFDEAEALGYISAADRELLCGDIVDAALEQMKADIAASKGALYHQDPHRMVAAPGPLLSGPQGLLMPKKVKRDDAQTVLNQIDDTERLRELTENERSLRRQIREAGVRRPHAVHEFEAIANANIRRARKIARRAASIEASTKKNPTPDLSLNPKVRAARLKKLSKAARRARRHQRFGRGKQGTEISRVTMVHQPPTEG
jgi:hypothetical protein